MLTALQGCHSAGSGMSSASKGNERELFLDLLLSASFPTPYRFGTGDIVDGTGARSGQIDIVMENPFFPSLPYASGSRVRLYIAEGVAAAIEVKSDLSKQWKEVKGTADALAKVRRQEDWVLSFKGDRDTEDSGNRVIPMFAVGYTGWKKTATLRKQLERSKLAGIFVVDPPRFVCRKWMQLADSEGEAALWGFLSALHRVAATVQSTDSALFDWYVNQREPSS